MDDDGAKADYAYRHHAGLPCLNCAHTHIDHSMYEPRLCYIGECQCQGLKINTSTT